MFTTARMVISIGVAVLLTTAACSSSGDKQAGDLDAADTAVPTATPQATTANTPAPTSTPAPTATPVPVEVKVVESGFTAYADSSGTIIGSWAAILQNVDTGHQATNTSITAIFYDANNVVLKSDSTTITLFLPGMTSAAGATYVSLTAQPARLEVRVAGTKFIDPPQAPLTFEATDVAYAPGQFSAVINGKIANPSSRDITNMEVVCMMVGPDGKFAAIGSTFLELMPGGATTVASCRLDSRLQVPAGSTAKMFPAFGYITQVAQ